MSYAATTTLINTVTTDAAFRTWGSAINAKLASMGLINTADTGQINWTTVLASTVTNTSQGYEIWRFNDSLQSTVPIFLKIEYGCGTAVANPSLWITVGSGSNGSGTLTGVLTPRQQISCTATAGAITHFWSGDTNRVAITAFGAGSATSFFLGIERTVDTGGNITAEGALLIIKHVGNWNQIAWNQITGPYTATWELSLGAMGASLAPFGSFGAQIAIYPIYHNKGIFMNPGLNALVYEGPLITTGSVVSFTIYGVTHTFMPLGATVSGTVGRGGFGTPAIMMRYE
jgi:hypothetical protein